MVIYAYPDTLNALCLDVRLLECVCIAGITRLCGMFHASLRNFVRQGSRWSLPKGGAEPAKGGAEVAFFSFLRQCPILARSLR